MCESCRVEGTVDFTTKDGRAARLRVASVADAAALVELDTALLEAGDGTVGGPEDARSVEEEARRIDDLYRGFSAGDASTSIVAELMEPQSRIVAMAGLKQFGPSFLRHVAYLGIGVHPSFQAQGVGRALMQALLDHAKLCGIERLELYVRSDNVRAHSLYRAFGFSYEGTRRKFVKIAGGTYIDDQIWVRFLA